jgi:hypothetical protein
MSRKHRRNMQHRVVESNITTQVELDIIEEQVEEVEEEEVEQELLGQEVLEQELVEQELPQPIIEQPILQYNDKDFVVVQNEGQTFPIKYGRAKAMGYKVLRKL